MKTKIYLILGITVALCLSSCVEDKIISDTQIVKSISVTAQDFQDADAGTRAAYNVDGTGFHFTWKDGDTVGVWPVGGDQVAFPISNGEGEQTSKFDGGAWALRSSYSYAAYYPFASDNYQVNETSIPVSYLGQTQNGNGSLDCLDRYDYQASVATSPDDDGNVNIFLKHLGCFVRFQLIMPGADTYQSLTLKSNKTPFITFGKYDLTKNPISITANSTSSIYVSLSNTSTTEENKVLTIYVMLAPQDLSNSVISIFIKGTKYDSYTASVSGKNMLAGKAYSYKATIQEVTDIDGQDVLWDERGHVFKPEYVNLGLSVNWATFNVGATRPEEYGDFYAWGETESYYEAGYAQEKPQAHWKEEKSAGYAWSSYKWCNGSSTTLTKYCSSSFYGNDNFTDTQTTLDLENDVAHVKWGGNWRMPTLEELAELRNKCTWKWYGSGNTEFNGVAGYKVSSNVSGYNDRFIFLPAAGFRDGTGLLNVGYGGYYWSSSLEMGYPNYAYELDLDSRDVDWDYDDRCYGFSVRPVCEYNPKSSFELNTTEVGLVVGGKSVQIKANPIDNGGTAISGSVIWSSSDENIAIVTSDGTVTAVGEGTCTITASIGPHQSNTCKIIVTSVSGKDNGFGYIDLGLSVNWATFNVGAEQIEDYGDYYAWGETEPKDSYYASTYKWFNGSSTNITKYNNISNNGVVDNKIILEKEDDVAHIRWGGNWRMPTIDEQNELRENCTWTWTTLNDVKGYIVRSNMPGYTDRFIFLPATGYREGMRLYDVGSYYWSSSLNVNHSDYAWMLCFDSKSQGTYHLGDRYFGRSVRPVIYSKTYYIVNSIILDKTELSLIVGGKSFQIKTTCKNNVDKTLSDNVIWSSSNKNIAIVSSDGIVTAVGEGTCTITASVGTVNSTCKVVVTPSNNGYGYVNLGLSVNWATYNVDAEQPEEFGGYYSWGEVETKNVYSWSAYKYGSGKESVFNKYCHSSSFGSNGFMDNKYILDSDDDVAHVKWASNWRMPTKAELDELYNNCTWTWTNYNGVNGYKITSNKSGYRDRSIFLPAAGYHQKDDYYSGSLSYWSSSLYTYNSDPQYAWGISYKYNSTNDNAIVCDERRIGKSVRPVFP